MLLSRAYEEVPAFAQLAHPLLHLVLAAQAALQDLEVCNTQTTGTEHGNLQQAHSQEHMSELMREGGSKGGRDGGGREGGCMWVSTG